MCRAYVRRERSRATVRLHVVVPDGGRGAAAEAQAAENPSDATDTAAKCQLPGDRVVRCDDRERTRRVTRGSRRVRRGRGAVCRTASDSKPIRTPLSPLRTRDRAACCIVDAFPSGRAVNFRISIVILRRSSINASSGLYCDDDSRPCHPHASACEMSSSRYKYLSIFSSAALRAAEAALAISSISRELSRLAAELA